MSGTVLLPTTGWEYWNRKAANVIAEMEDPPCTVVLLHEFSRQEAEAMLTDGAPTLDSATLNQLTANRSDVSTIETILAESDITLETKGVLDRDDRGDTITREIDEQDVDRVYLHCRRRSPTGKAVFGSVLQETITRVNVPVIVIPPNM